MVFYGDQVAVTANVQPEAADLQARLLVVDVDLDANTAAVSSDLIIPSLGGATESLAVNSNGSVIYMTGKSVSERAAAGEAFRAVWDGVGAIETTPLGSIPGFQSVTPVFQSVGYAVNANGVVAGTSDNDQAIFEFDQEMVHAGRPPLLGVLLGISDDRVKVGLTIVVDISGTVWEADNQTSRYVADVHDDGTALLAISPDHSRLLGTTTDILEVGRTEYLTWWTYGGDATIVEDAAGNPIAGRLTGGTNANVGYHVGQSAEAATGDLLHIESTNQTLRIVDWFESLSGMELPGETSNWGPEIAYDADTGQVAIISGGYLFTAKVYDVVPPVAVADAYTTPVDVPLVVDAPGVLGNDSDNLNMLQAVLVTPPAYGTLDFHADGSFTYTPQSGFNREDAFTYKANDGHNDSEVVTVDITLETQYPWHNGLRALDVNDDSFVTAVDALQIINTLNILGSRPLESRPHPLVKPFYDTSPDNWVSPRDALLVINYLNQGGQPEGEGAADGLYSDEPATYGSLVALTTGTAGAGLETSSLGTPARAAAAAQAALEVDFWSTDLLQIGVSQSGLADNDVRAEWAGYQSLTDLEDTLSLLVRPFSDEL